jgi:protein-tyrosine phosphatase
MAKLIDEKSLEIDIDSAGTGDWHVGNLPDERMRKHCGARGYPMTMTARQITAKDFDRFDLILAMDESNYSNICSLTNSQEDHAKVKMMCSYCSSHDVLEVPDPYYGEGEGFELVIDILEDACAGLLEEIQNKD